MALGRRPGPGWPSMRGMSTNGADFGTGGKDDTGGQPPNPRVFPTWRPPRANVDFKAVCDAVLKARNGSGETMIDIAARFGVSRGWLHKWVFPALDGGDD